MKTLLTIAALLLASASWAETPKERAEQYFSDLVKRDYEAAATHFAPGELAEFRSLFSFYTALPAEAQVQFVQTFFGPTQTVESVGKLSDSQFFSGVLGFIFRRAEQAGGLKLDGLEVLGAVEEGDDLRHLVTRNRVSVGALDTVAMEVLSMRREGDGWRVMMTGKIKGLPAQIEAALKRRGG